MKKSWMHNFYFKQWIATLGAFILMMVMGISVGWASPNLARLTDKDSVIPLTKDQASWVVSLSSLGGFIGPFVGSLLMEFIGGRKTIILTLIIFGVSWIFLIVANSPDWLYASRFISGISGSMSQCSFALFLGEISEPSIRGTTISTATVGASLGSIIGTAAESYLTMKVSSSIYLILCFAAIAIFIWIMDSPYYLIKENNLKAASKALKFYDDKCDVEVKLNEMKLFHETTAKQGIKERIKEFQNPVIRKSIILIITLCALPFMGGILNIMGYMEIILKDGQSFLVEPKQFVIYANITAVLVTFVAIKFIDTVGRKILLIISYTGMCVALIFLGVHFALLKSNFNPETIQWLPMICMLAYLVTYAVGFTIPNTILGEIFPENTKNFAACLAILSAAVFAFAFSKTYQPMVDAVGESYVFFIYAALIFLGIPITLIFLPETKGKTLQEIQDLLSKNKNTSKL